ncbi:hypothetical protein [Romboutsia faecis]|nr:hypothetical protein [Romboutsia faecis]
MNKLGMNFSQRFFSFFNWGFYFSARRLLCKNKEIFLMRIISIYM